MLASFKSGSIPCLVATNVAARGLDIEGVSHVIQLGLPDDRETFIHRSGRTGRAGHEGVNLVLLSPAEFGRFREMLKGTTIKTEWLDIPGIDKIRAAWRDSAEQDIFAAPVDAFFGECVKWAEDLTKRAEPKILIAKLLAILGAKNKGYDLANELRHELERKNKKGKPQSQARIRTDKPRGVFKRFRSSKAQTTGNILNAMCRGLNVDKSQVGAIRINDNFVLVELMSDAVDSLEHGKPDFSRFGLFHEEDMKDRKDRKQQQRRRSRKR